jgi:hypothetical protein
MFFRNESHVTTDGQLAHMSRCQAHSATCDQILLSVRMLSSESCEVEVTLRLTYVLVSTTLVGLATRYYFLSECCCLKFVLHLLGSLSDERAGLQFAV